MALYEETKRIQQELDNKYNQDDPLKYVFTKLSNINRNLSATGQPTLDINPSEDTGIYLPKDNRNFGRFFGEVYNPLTNIENAAALRQSGWERMGYMIPRIGVKVASEVAQLPGYLGGALAWGATGFDKDQIGLMVDNFWQKAVQSAEESVKGKLPVYVSDKVKEGGLMQNIFSTAFWATEGADGIGFLLSYLVPGQVLKHTGLGAKAAKLIKPGNKISKLMSQGASYEEAINAATKGMKETFDFVGATVINTLFESAAEGGETFRNVLDKTGDREKAANAAVDVVNKNFGILLASNAVDQYWLFKDINMFKKVGADATENLTKKNILDRLIDPKTKKVLSEVKQKTKWEKAGELSKQLFEGIGKEGFYEEGLQFAASKQAENDVENPEEADRGFVDEMIDLADTYLESLSDTDMQKSIFLGSVLGGGMSMVGYKRQQEAEKRLLEGTSAKSPSPFAKFFGVKERKETPGLKQLLERNMNAYHINLSDVAKKDVNGNPELNPDGTYVWDDDKIKELAVDKILDYAEKEKLVAFAKSGNKEGFKLIKDKLDYRYMSLFIQQEGGVNTLLKHIDEMSELEKEYFAKEGVEFNLDSIKKELKDKALRFQAMYDRVENTHDLLMSDVKYEKEDKDLFNKYSEKVRNNKIQEERISAFSENRINSLRNELSNLNYNDNVISITSDQNNLSDSLVEGLKKSYDEQKNNLSDAVKKQVERTIDDIEEHQKELKRSREFSSKLYNKSWLNNTFKEYKDRIKEVNETTLDGNKATEAARLSPKLRALYNKAVIMEEFNEPVKAVARHSGDVQVTYTTPDGKTHRIVGNIIGDNSQGNLTLRSVKEEVNGRLKKVDTGTTFYINENDTIGINKEQFPITPDGIDIIKAPEDVLKERRSTTLLETLRDQLNEQREGIKNYKDRVLIQHEYIEELKAKANELDKVELEILERTGSKLTSKGTSRKISVGIAPGSLAVKVENKKYVNVKKRQFLTTEELQRELKNAIRVHQELVDNFNTWTENKKKVTEAIKKAKEDGNYYKLFDKEVENTNKEFQVTKDAISKDQELIDNSTIYLQRLRSTLKGYFTSFANVLGIAPRLLELRNNSDFTPQEIEEQSIELISSALSSIELTDKMIESLGILPENLQIIQDRIQQTINNINNTQVNLAENQIKLEELRGIVKLYSSIAKNYRDNYLKYLNNVLGVTTELVDEETKKSETPEENFEELRDREEQFTRELETDFKHVYTDKDSFIITGGDQTELMKGSQNDDLARWYIFVNKLAHQEKNSKYVLRSFTVSQVASLKDDNVVKKSLKFYAGKIKGIPQYVTYNQLQNLPKENQDIANDDIKVVVYEDNKPLLVSKQVIDSNEGKYYLIYNSLLKEDKNIFGNRFSKAKAIDARIKEMKYPFDTDEEKSIANAKAKAFIDEKYDKDFESYLKFREDLKKESYYFGINFINPGVKNYSGVTEIELTDFIGDKDVSRLRDSIYIHKIGTRKNDKRNKNVKGNFGHRITRQFSGAEHGVTSGYAYLGWDNRFELIKPRTIGETGSVEEVLSILRYLATNPKDYEEIEKYLHKIVYINAQNNKYRLYFTKFYGPNNTKRGFRTLLFGDKEISAQDLANGENLDDLREFLSTKYWNIDEKAVDSTSFTEFKVTWSETNKPNVTSILWDTKKGGYVGFLFSGENRVPKGRVLAKPAEESPLATVRNPNYINQSLSLTSLGTTYKKEKPATTNKTNTDPQDKKPVKKGIRPTEEGATTKKGIRPSSGEVVDQKKIKLGRKPKDETEESEETKEAPKQKKTLRPSGLGIQTAPDAAENVSTPVSSNNKKYNTPQELWNSLTKEGQSAYLNMFKEPAEVVMKKVFEIYQSSFGEINRIKDQNELFIQEELNSKIEWYKNKFPQIPIKVVEDTVLKDAWGRLTKDGIVLISDLAAEGTIYHEAFHTYSLLFSTEEERKLLYNEVRNRLNKPEMSDKQTEEFLAEEFRMYMTSPNEYKFNEKDKVVKSWFDKILDYILEILKDFNIIKSDKPGFRIEETFNKINIENSFKIADETLNDRINNLRTNYDQSRTITGLTERETMYFVQDFNFQFFQKLFDPKSTLNPETLFEISTNSEELYNRLYIFYDLNKGSNPSYEKILKNFDEIIVLHKKFLKLYGIEIPGKAGRTSDRVEDIKEEDIEGLNSIDEDEKTKSKTDYQDSIQVNMDELIDNPIRMLIAGLPAVTMVNNMVKAELSEYLTRSTTKYGDIIRVLRDNLSTLTSVSDMASVLKSLSYTYPELTILLKRLGLNESNEKVATTQQVALQNQLYKNFALNKNNPILYNYTHTGTKYQFSATEDNVEEILRNQWINNARLKATSDDNSSYIYKSKGGEFLVDIKELKEDLKYLNSLDKIARLKPSIDILSNLGINLPMIADESIDNYLFWLGDSVKDMTKNVSILDFYNRDIVKVQKEFDALLKYASKNYINNKDLSYFNQDGNREFSITLNSHISNIVNLLNTIKVDKKNNILEVPPELEYLMGWNNTTQKGSLFNRNSTWLDYILDGRKIELVLLKGLVTPVDGTEISKLELGDYKATTFNSLLQGVVPLLRSADRKLEYGFKIGTVNTNITDSIFKDTMYKYLEDELATSFALLLDPANWGGRLKHYSERAKNLRVFSFLHEDSKLPSLEEFVNDHISKKYDSLKIEAKTKAATVEEADRMVKEFLKVYKKRIDSNFDNYLEDLYKTTYDSLQEDELIVKEQRGSKLVKYSIPGLDLEVLDKIGIKSPKIDPVLTREQMDRLVRIATYHSFVGNNEQLKLFLGDLAYYRDASDFHKRVNGATSTKYSQRDDLFLREHLNENYRRFDNKQRTDSMSMVIVEDIYYNNEELSKLNSAYSNANGTDAESWIMLDEYRDIMLRHGLWYPRHERTYQYDMQKFAIKLIDLIENKGKEYKIDINKIKDQFTSPKGVFFNHTKGIIPKVPLYRGEEIKESSLTPLQILKPQGFGHINNSELDGLNATSYWKTSAAPIFMTAISEESPMFEFLVNMMANQQSVLTFSNYKSGSAIKGDLLGDENGKIQKIFEQDDYFSQDIRYRDFGIQLDIHEESEGEVSVSSQRTRLEFLDIFNLGEPVKNEELVKNRHDYTELTNDIEIQLREELLKDLGIILKDNKYLLPEDNKEKFKKKLISAFETRQMPLNILDGIELSLDPQLGLNMFDLSLSKFKIEEILTSMVRNNLIKRKVFGEMLIQESAFLYENPNSTKRLLEFYQRTFPDGKKKAPVITPMQVMISVPKSMIEYVDSIGGVDVLNKALDTYYETGDYGILGEDFIDLLTMPANRIPGQSLGSLDIIQVRRFFPHYHGNKVVIPAEATVKAGSDFDVDKLTVYFNNFFSKDGKLKFDDNLKSVKGKQNKLNILAEDSLLDPERFEELVTPLDSSYLKKAAESIRERKTNATDIEKRSSKPVLKDVIHWWYNMQKGYEFWTSKSGVAATAVQNAAHAIEQNHPIEMTDIIPLLFEGQELGFGETYKSGFIKDSSGRNISNNLAEFITAFVDAVKDPFIFEITDTSTFSAIAALNRFGKNASVGIDSIIEFYSQPVVKDFIKIKRVNSSQYMFFNQYNTGKSKWKFNHRLNRDKQYRTILQKLKNQLKATIDIPISYSSSVASAVENYIQIRTSVYNTNEKLEEYTSIENLAERLKAIELATDTNSEVLKAKEEISSRINKYGYKYLSLEDLKNIKSGKGLTNDELFKLQVQILDNYMMYNQLGWNVGTVNSFLRPDASSSLGRHLSAIDASIQVTDQTIRKRGLFNYDSILYAIAGRSGNPSLIKEFFETKQNTSSFYSWGSLINTNPTVKEFFEKNIYSVFADSDRRLSRVKAEAAIDTIESNFISFLLVKMFGTMSSKELQRVYKSIFMGKNSIAKQLLRVKRDLKGNLAIDELEAILSKKISQSQTISELDTVSLFSKQFDINQWNTLEADMYDLYHSSEDNKAFVNGLIYLNILQSGYKKSPSSFSEIIPNRIFMPMAAVALNKFVSLPEGEQLLYMQRFIKQMYKNNVSNKDIVPRHKFPVDYNQTYIEDKKGYYKNLRFISANMYIDSPYKYWDENRKAPMTVALYERDAENPDLFMLVSKMGGEFFEYYPDATDEEIETLSIVNANYYEYNLDNPIKVEKDSRPSKKNQVVEEDESDYEDNIDSSALYFSAPKKSSEKTTNKKTTKKKSNIKGLEEDYYTEITFVDGKNSYARSNQKDTKLHIVLRSIENKSDNLVNIALARAIKEEIKSPIDLEIYDSNWRENNISSKRSRYNGYTAVTEKGRAMKIGVYEELSDPSFELVTLHEGIHALTLYKYRTDSIFRNQINNLYNHVKEYVYANKALEGSYSLDIMEKSLLLDEEEFIAEAISDPEYQKLLSTIPAFDESNIKDLSKSVFSQFIDRVFNLLREFFSRHPEHIDNLTKSAFKELLSVTDDALLRKDVDELDFIDEMSTAEVMQLRKNYKEEVKQSNEYEQSKESINKGSKENYIEKLKLLDEIRREATPADLTGSQLMTYKQVDSYTFKEYETIPNKYDFNLTSLFLYGVRYDDIKNLKNTTIQEEESDIIPEGMDYMDYMSDIESKRADKYEEVKMNIDLKKAEVRELAYRILNNFKFKGGPSKAGVTKLTQHPEVINEFINLENPVRTFFEKDIFELIEKSEEFNSLYPDYRHLTSIEREAFLDAVRLGDIQLACGL